MTPPISIWRRLTLVAALLTACGNPAATTPTADTLPPPVISTPTVPPATPTPAELSTPELALAAYLEAFTTRDLTRLTGLVTPDSQGGSAEAFQQSVTQLLGNTLTATEIEARPGAVTVDGANATATVDLRYQTALV
ncbi:MAG TPA: hypothetical protein PK954_02415, partial [Anaerolineales bacterium]|nr:hypothetical protein [Anaerolineales bacterium]